jgi:hypothetical protein
MKSVRLDEGLQERLGATARRLGVGESEVIRMALDEFCDAKPGRSLFDELKPLLKEWEAEDAGQPAVDIAGNAKRLYSERLYEDYLKKQDAYRRVAETRASYKPQSDPD